MKRRDVARARDHGEGGFSLIEVLVTLTILTAMMAVFTPLAGRMLGSWARDADRAGRADMVTAAVDRLRRDIAIALPAVAEGSDPPVMRFAGSAGGFSFLAATGGMPELITVSTVPGADGTPALVRTARRADATDGARATETRVALLDHPLGARFAFRSRKGVDSADWREQAEMPQAIVVTFTRGRDVLLGGPLILPLRATLPVICVVAEGGAGQICPDSGGNPPQPSAARGSDQPGNAAGGNNSFGGGFSGGSGSFGGGS